MIRGVRFAPLLVIFTLACPARGAALNALAGATAAALKSGDAINADNLATQALAIGALSENDRAHVLLNRGLARERLQHPAEALVDFSAALALNVLSGEDKARALFDRGVSYDEMGRTNEAIADYSSSLELNPAFAPALNNRGNAYRRAGKFESAKRDYLASLAANNPQPEYPQYGLGQIAEAQKDPAAARDWYRQALNANPNYKPASDRIAAIGDVFTPVLKLKPPQTVVASDASPGGMIVLRPPIDRAARRTAPEKHSFEPLTPTVAPASYAPPQDMPELRPAIVEVLKTPKQIEAGPATGSAQVQLGAWKDEADAARGWNQIVGKAGGLLDGATPQIVMTDIPGKGRYYRLRANSAASGSSEGLCGKLHALGLACIPAR